MSEKAKGRNHPQSPRKLPRPGSGRNRKAKGYDPSQRRWLTKEEQREHQ